MFQLFHRSCLGTALAALAAVLLSAPGAQAAPIELGSFHVLNANQPLSFTNNAGTSGTLTATNVAVIFNYTVQSGLATTDHSATLTINPPGTLPTTTPETVSGNSLDQPINPLTFSIIENGTGKNLLSMSPAGSDLLGLNGTVDASLSGMHTGVFSSDFGTFSGSASESFNFGLATISPALSTGPGGFLNSFVANLNGQFSVDSTGFTPVPEPASAGLLGLALLSQMAFVRQRKRRS